MSIDAAIQGRNLLSFMYDGFRRTVEPHAYRHDVGATCGFEQGTGISSIGLVPFYVGPDVGGR